MNMEITMGNVPEGYVDTFYEIWDSEDIEGSINRISVELGVSRRVVTGHCKSLGLMKRTRIESRMGKYRDPEKPKECLRYSICPKCGKRLAIERIPWTKSWDCFCITCSRFPIPEGYQDEDV